MKSALAAASLVVIAGATAGCKTAKSAEHEPGAGVTAAPAQVNTHTVTSKLVPKYLLVTGQLKSSRETDLAANASGKVVQTRVERGTQVKAGETLATLDVRAASLSAAEARAHAETAAQQAKTAKSDCERADVLLQSGAISRAEFDRLDAQCRTTDFQVSAAQARLKLAAQNVGDGVIRAPFNGFVTERYIDVGEYVTPSSKVVTIVDPRVAPPRAHRPRDEHRSGEERRRRLVHGGRLSGPHLRRQGPVHRRLGPRRDARHRRRGDRRQRRRAPAARHVRVRAAPERRGEDAGRAEECGRHARRQADRLRRRRTAASSSASSRRVTSWATRSSCSAGIAEGERVVLAPADSPQERPDRQVAGSTGSNTEETLMQWLARVCVQRPVFATVLMLVLLVIGGVGVRQARRRPVPQRRLPGRRRDDALPGAAPRRSRPTSPTRSKAPSTRSAASTSSARRPARASRIVIVTFDLEKDVDVAAQEVRDKVNTVMPDLPKGIDQPVVSKLDPDASPILFFAAALGAADPRDHRARRQARAPPDREHRRRRPGQHPRRPQAPDQRARSTRSRSARAGVTASTCSAPSPRRTSTTPGGSVETGPKSSRSASHGRVADVEADRPHRRPPGGRVTRSASTTSARVEDGAEERRHAAQLDGEPDGRPPIRKQSGKNTVAVVDAVLGAARRGAEGAAARVLARASCATTRASSAPASTR